jgi:hypothetical protein
MRCGNVLADVLKMRGRCKNLDVPEVGRSAKHPNVHSRVTREVGRFARHASRIGDERVVVKNKAREWAGEFIRITRKQAVLQNRAEGVTLARALTAANECARRVSDIVENAGVHCVTVIEVARLRGPRRDVGSQKTVLRRAIGFRKRLHDFRREDGNGARDRRLWEIVLEKLKMRMWLGGRAARVAVQVREHVGCRPIHGGTEVSKHAGGN